MCGGNISPQQKLLLKKLEVEFLYTGEEEKTGIDFVRHWITVKQKSDFAELEGLSFIHYNNVFIFTTYPEVPSYNPAMAILRKGR